MPKLEGEPRFEEPRRVERRETVASSPAEPDTELSVSQQILLDEAWRDANPFPVYPSIIRSSLKGFLKDLFGLR